METRISSVRVPSGIGFFQLGAYRFVSIRSDTDNSFFHRYLGMRGLDVAFYKPRSRYHNIDDDMKHSKTIRFSSPDFFPLTILQLAKVQSGTCSGALFTRYAQWLMILAVNLIRMEAQERANQVFGLIVRTYSFLPLTLNSRV